MSQKEERMSSEGSTEVVTSRAVGRAILLMLVLGLSLVSCNYDAWLAPLLTPGAPQPVPGLATPQPLAATTTSAPAPSATPQQPPASGTAFGLAWFHKPPEDGTSARVMAAEHKYIHLTSLADVPYMQELRQAGYDGPIYTYMVAYAVEGPGPYKNSSERCDQNYEPYDNNFAWSKGDFCKYIHDHESWFMHNAAGERLVMDYFGSGHWTYLMNPADPGWREFSYERLRTARDTMGYSGVWLDNLDLSLNRARQEMANKDGAVREFSNNDEFQAAMKGWLEGAHAAVGDWPIWANMVAGSRAAEAWDVYAPYLDGGMEESFSVDWLDGMLSAANWNLQLQRAERWLASGKGLVLVGQGKREDENTMRFTLASYMLVAQPGKAFYRYTRFDTYYGEVWLFPDFETARALGSPLGPRQEVRPGIWRRDFSGGHVEVDVNDYIGRLVLK